MCFLVRLFLHIRILIVLDIALLLLLLMTRLLKIIPLLIKPSSCYYPSYSSSYSSSSSTSSSYYLLLLIVIVLLLNITMIRLLCNLRARVLIIDIMLFLPRVSLHMIIIPSSSPPSPSPLFDLRPGSTPEDLSCAAA